jgi:hypothetical protein
LLCSQFWAATGEFTRAPAASRGFCFCVGAVRFLRSPFHQGLRPPLLLEALSPAAAMILVMVSAELTMMTSFTLRRVHRTGDAA